MFRIASPPLFLIRRSVSKNSQLDGEANNTQPGSIYRQPSYNGLTCYKFDTTFVTVEYAVTFVTPMIRGTVQRREGNTVCILCLIESWHCCVKDGLDASL